MFQPRFHDAVASGNKQQTIRPPRKRAIRVGEPLSLRAWTGKPYRSKQRELRRAQCIEVRPLVIDREFSDERMASADGFADADDMKNWFAATHGLPFTGILIRWT